MAGGGRRPGGNQPIPRPHAWRPGGPAPWAGLVGTGELSVDAVVARVATASATAGAAVAPLPDVRRTAVLVALRQGSAGAEVLLTRRALHLRSHRGEISFPGGRLEPGESPTDAALREADEEVALDQDAVQVAGELGHLSTMVTRSHIVPVVGRVAGAPELRANPDEVERVLWVPLAELAGEDTYTEEWWGTPPLDRPMFFFHLDDETVWGATARVLHELLSVAFGVLGPPPPSW